MKRTDPAKRYFSPKVTDRERAVFETGIALATVLHLLYGAPLPRDRAGIKALERAMERVIKTQPFRSLVRVRINPLKRGQETYGYDVARGENIYAYVEVKYGSAKSIGELRWIKRLKYPLMYIRDIKSTG